MRLSGRFFCYWPQDFPAVSVFTGRDFPAVSVVNGQDFPAVSAVTGSGIFRQYLELLVGIFRPKLFRHGNVKSVPPGTRRPGFSGRICSFWPGFSGHSFSGMGNLKKLYGRQANCSGIDSGILCP
jgi:hypothetical protein